MAATLGKASWADLEDSPVSGGGVPSTAARARWVDLAEEEEEESPGPTETSCAAASRDLDAASDCSTSADDGAEPLRERGAELASDEDAAQSALVAAPAAIEKGIAARRRAGRAEDRASKQRGAAPRAKAAAQWQHQGGWQDSGSSWGRQRASRQGKESWNTWGPRDSWKDSNAAQQPRRQRRQGAAGAVGKRQCQFTIGIEEEPKFRVVRRLIGEHGKHVKRIAEVSGGAKLRLRGRGSGFLEGPEQEESSDPLMMCVSAPDERSYGIAVRLLREHLEDVYEQHRSAYPGAAEVRVSLHEGFREGSC